MTYRRLVSPREVLEIDLHDHFMEKLSGPGNGYLLLAVDRAGRFFAVYASNSKNGMCC